MAIDRALLVPALKNIATRLRIDSIRSTSEAGSGHPTSCCSMADIMAALFFAEMRFDPKRSAQSGQRSVRAVEGARRADSLRRVGRGRRVRSVGAAEAAPRSIPISKAIPTPRLPFVDVATGSLGQGICAAIGIALNARRIESDYRTYVLLGDGESAEGSVWEAADVGRRSIGSTTCAASPTSTASARAVRRCGSTTWSSSRAAGARFGWHAIVIDGHDMNAILDALRRSARDTKGRPTMILARTIKGKGVSFVEGQGRAGTARRSRRARNSIARSPSSSSSSCRCRTRSAANLARADSEAGLPSLAPIRQRRSRSRRPPTSCGDQVATREAYGTAIAKLGEADARVVALDADVKNSTFSDKFEKALPDRFYQNFIAEQVMVGAAMGLAARGAIPFPSTFACFLTRAADFIRMAAISNVNIKLAGSHAGVSIGEDGPSQMALEDLAMCRAQPNFTVLYPCDAVSTERLVALMAVPPRARRTSAPAGRRRRSSTRTTRRSRSAG